MSQAMASLSRNLLTFFICALLAACNGSYTAFESDRDFIVDLRTADIEKDNAELKTLAAVQSAFFGHYQSAAYEFLDASDLPIDATSFEITDDTPEDEKKYDYKRFCSNGASGGSILYYYSRDRDAGEEHKAGDEISVKYKNCLEDDILYSGSMTGRYTQIKGLNNRFVELDTGQCLARVQEKLNINNTFINSAEYDVENNFDTLDGNEVFSQNGKIQFSNNAAIYLIGDELRFEQVGSELRVDLLRVAFSNSGDEDNINIEKTINVELSLFIKEDQKIIIILEPREPSPEMVTSVNGDDIYVIENLKNTKQNCQGFERTLSISLQDFSSKKTDFLQTILNGSVTLVETQETSNRMDQSFEQSNFKTTVVQENSTQIYTMKDFSVQKGVNLANNSYAYNIQGLVSNTDMLGGQIGIITISTLYGSFDSNFPSSGTFELQGQGLERVDLVLDNAKISLQVDFNGDSTGNGFADIDYTINTNWVDLFERNFIE
tara:strand:+ start:25278 stop:26750 length:1473 start_codon:yes stop_codon:yes gene_type:complete